MPSSPGSIRVCCSVPVSAASAAAVKGGTGFELAWRLGPRSIFSFASLIGVKPASHTARIVKYLIPCGPDSSGP